MLKMVLSLIIGVMMWMVVLALRSVLPHSSMTVFGVVAFVGILVLSLIAGFIVTLTDKRKRIAVAAMPTLAFYLYLFCLIGMGRAVTMGRALQDLAVVILVSLLAAFLGGFVARLRAKSRSRCGVNSVSKT